jgi:hypothetical protein
MGVSDIVLRLAVGIAGVFHFNTILGSGRVFERMMALD